MTMDSFGSDIERALARTRFIMLRYETEHTRCGGIAPVATQERRHFPNGIMIAPLCPRLKRDKPEDDPLKNGQIRDTGQRFNVSGKLCSVLATTDPFIPIIFLHVEGRFQGYESPYDTPPEPPENSSIATLKRDTLYFGLAVHEFLKQAHIPQVQFIWGADWETVPALFLLCGKYIIALTLHNSIDECLEDQAEEFRNTFPDFCTPRLWPDGIRRPARTALQIGIEKADIVTAVNRGFAHGIQTERLHKAVMAAHIQDLLAAKTSAHCFVGINNAGFTTLDSELIALGQLLNSNLEAGKKQLFDIKEQAAARLPEALKQKAAGKAMVVSMGRRVSQKQHDVLTEAVREILSNDRDFPVLVVFATVHGDSNSPAILARIKSLEADFPFNVVWEDGQLSYYNDLMTAADFNCMSSLFEPHGGAYQGIVIPIARAVDGLAEQICGYNPSGMAKLLNDRWHSKDEQPTGFLYREDLEYLESKSTSELLADQFEAILKGSPFSRVFQAMRDSLGVALRAAVELRLKRKDDYARLVAAALKKQQGLSWEANLAEMLKLVDKVHSMRQP
jgi:hypothetical protein